MCGICGIFSLGGTLPDRQLIQKMCAALVHRGPDDEGLYLNGPVGLGMRRLSIIDLVTGHQPISNEDRTVWVVQNGEIYNFPQLRQELLAKGHKFSSRTDTEVIAHAYEEYGLDFATKLRGMFAIAVWDDNNQRLILARDRLGKKPLYYSLNKGKLAFASELKALLADPEFDKQIDPASIDTFLTLEYIPSPGTIFAKVKKLLPGHLLIVSRRREETKRFWQVNFQPRFSDPAEAQAALRRTLTEAVRLRLISDVPLGAFLSGGLDSTAIVGLMRELGVDPVKTFSIGFRDPSYNELPYARLAAKKFGTEHEELIIEPQVVDLVDKLVYYLDEPLADFSIFPTYLVSQLARKKVTVALSGDGGDELFLGYDHYQAQQLARYFDWLPLSGRVLLSRLWDRLPPQEQKKGLVNIFKRYFEGLALPRDLENLRWQTFLAGSDKERLYSPGFRDQVRDNDPYQRMRQLRREAGGLPRLEREGYVDLNCYLVDDIMVKVDRMSMANSLEARAPFLDQEFVEVACRIPAGLKLAGGRSKAIMRRALADLYPPEILARRDKQGFSIPIKNWLRRELKDLLLANLSSDQVKKRGYFQPAQVGRLISEHLGGRSNHSHKLWPLLVLELWQKRFIDRP